MSADGGTQGIESHILVPMQLRCRMPLRTDGGEQPFWATWAFQPTPRWAADQQPAVSGAQGPLPGPEQSQSQGGGEWEEGGISGWNHLRTPDRTAAGGGPPSFLLFSCSLSQHQLLRVQPCPRKAFRTPCLLFQQGGGGGQSKSLKGACTLTPGPHGTCPHMVKGTLQV